MSLPLLSSYNSNFPFRGLPPPQNTHETQQRPKLLPLLTAVQTTSGPLLCPHRPQGSRAPLCPWHVLGHEPCTAPARGGRAVLPHHTAQLHGPAPPAPLHPLVLGLLGARPSSRARGQDRGRAGAGGGEGASEPPRGPGLPLPGEGGTGSVLGQRQEQTAEAGGTSGLRLVQTPLSRWPRTVSRGW